MDSPVAFYFIFDKARKTVQVHDDESKVREIPKPLDIHILTSPDKPATALLQANTCASAFSLCNHCVTPIYWHATDKPLALASYDYTFNCAKPRGEMLCFLANELWDEGMNSWDKINLLEVGIAEIFNEYYGVKIKTKVRKQRTLKATQDQLSPREKLAYFELPIWSLEEASTVTGRDKKTLQNKASAGLLPGAKNVPGWGVVIDVEGFLAGMRGEVEAEAEEPSTHRVPKNKSKRISSSKPDSFI